MVLNFFPQPVQLVLEHDHLILDIDPLVLNLVLDNNQFGPDLVLWSSA